MREICSVLGVSRSHVTTRLRRPANWIDPRKAPPVADDEQLINDLLSTVHDRVSYGYRRIWTVLRHQGVDGRKYHINHKRVYRIMRDRHLLLYRHGARPVSHRRHEGKVAVGASNKRWCSDGFELSCDNGERVRVAFALDCRDREVMSWVATTKWIDAQPVGDLMMKAVEARFGPGQTAAQPAEWLSDNGSCYSAANTRQFARMLRLKPVTTPVASPQSDGMAEGFVKTFKRDFALLAKGPDSQCVMAALKQRFCITMNTVRTARWLTCHLGDSGRISSNDYITNTHGPVL